MPCHYLCPPLFPIPPFNTLLHNKNGIVILRSIVEKNALKPFKEEKSIDSEVWRERESFSN